VLAYVAGAMYWLQLSNFLFPAIVLIAPDAMRLVDVFILRRPTEPRPPVRLFRSPLLATAARATGIAYVAYTFIVSFTDSLTNRLERASLPPLWGMYDVEAFKRGGVSVSPSLTDSSQWRSITIGERWNAGTALVRSMADTKKTVHVTVDTTASTVTFGDMRAKQAGSRVLVPGGKALGTFRYSQPDVATLLLRGRMGKDSVEMRLRRLDERAFPLVRGSWSWDRIPYNGSFAHR
jgi:hypothetical protein